MVLITHDPDDAAVFGDHVLDLRDGRRSAPTRRGIEGSASHEQDGMNAENTGIGLDGEIWMTVGGENLGGPNRIALLAKIAECGSITQAAKAIGMSYKAAWDAIDAMNNLAGEPLVERLAGGKGGGGTAPDRARRAAGGELRADRARAPQLRRTRLSEHADGIADDYRPDQEDEHENQRTQPVRRHSHRG